MTDSNPRWATLGQLKGLRIVGDSQNYDSIAYAGVRRHPHHSSKITLDEIQPLSDAEHERYSELNGQLHKKLLATVQSHFRGTPVPEILRDACGSGTPFTYQNWDWFGPSYECYLVVWEDSVSSSLLCKLQLLLAGDFDDWCIMVCTTQKTDFDTNHEIAIFKNEVLIPQPAASDLKIDTR